MTEPIYSLTGCHQRIICLNKFYLTYYCHRQGDLGAYGREIPRCTASDAKLRLDQNFHTFGDESVKVKNSPHECGEPFLNVAFRFYLLDIAR